MSLNVVVPITITPALLVATDVPESDHPAWVAATTYAAGDRVQADHAIFESLLAGNVGNSPPSSPAQWVRVSATNRFKAFDLINASRTEQSGAFFFEIAPGKSVNAIAALDLVGATSIRIRVTDPTYGLLYDKTAALIAAPAFVSWWDWFYADRVSEPQYVALDLPAFPAATIRIDFVGTSALAVGTVLVGQTKPLGQARYGARIGIRDYSRKETNEWGDVVLVQRAFARTSSLPVLLSNAEKSRAAILLESLRATPTLWVGVEGDALYTIYGWYRDWEILIAYPTFSEMTIEIEGLT